MTNTDKKEVKLLSVEEAIARQQPTLEQARAVCLKYNEAKLNGKRKEADELNDELTKCVDLWNYLKEFEIFETLKKEEDVMLAAVKMYSLPVLRAVDKKDKNSSVTSTALKESEKAIDLGKLYKYCDGIGKNAEWIDHAERLNLIMTKWAAEEVGSTQDFSDYFYSKTAETFRFGTEAKVTSNTSLLKALKLVVAEMIGEEFNVISYDVNFMKTVFGKKGKEKLTVTAATHKQMRGILLDICHRIVMNVDAYKVDYKKKKD